MSPDGPQPAAGPPPTLGSPPTIGPQPYDGLPGAHAGPGRILRTARLMLLPPGEEMLADLTRLKADARVFGPMLHGVRSPARTREELEDDIAFWQVRGYGTWCVFLREGGEFLGICGFMERPDGRGVALRYALWPECRGHGYAREAARAALDFGHRAGLDRIIGVARETNAQSIEVLRDIGMRPAPGFQHQGHRMLVFESLASSKPRSDDPI